MARLLELPIEVMEQIFLRLDTKDLKALRLGHRSLEWDVRPTLFRTLHISCLNADRLVHIKKYPRISAVVTEIQFHEMNLEGFSLMHRSNTLREHDELSEYLTPLESLMSLVEDYGDLLRNGQFMSYFGKDLEAMTDHWESIAASGHDRYAPPLFWKFPTPLWFELEAKLTDVVAMYDGKAKLHDPRRLYRIFRTALPHLTELRRIVCVNGNPGGSGSEYRALENEGPFRTLNEDFHHLFSHSVLWRWL
jgi:hypothetical protein